MGNIRVYSDGLCYPNPNGVAAWGFVVYDGGKEIYSDKGLIPDGQTSNNLAEYVALEKALLYIEKNLADEKVNLYLDSRLILSQTRGKWNANADHLKPFRNRCQSLYREHQGIRLYYCKPQDNKADRLAQEAYRSVVGKKGN